MSTSQKIAGAIIFLSFFAGCVILFSDTIYRKNISNNTEQVFCTMEARQCPDGSFVGRGGPRCEFDPCPVDPEISSWKENDNNQNVSFFYPEKFNMIYTRPVSWPPNVSVSSGPFRCSSKKDTQPGVEESRRIGDRTYCIVAKDEGAAGSTYTTYTYSFEKNGTYFILNFKTKSVQCLNYDEPEQGKCVKERFTMSNDIDILIHKIVNTLVVKEPIELM